MRLRNESKKPNANVTADSHATVGYTLKRVFFFLAQKMEFGFC